MKRVLGWVLLGFVGNLTQCRARAHGENAEALENARCASACADWASRCPEEKPVRAPQSRCVEACLAARADAARGSCQKEQDQALTCLSTARISCEKVSALRSLLEQGQGVSGCEAEFARLARCAAPCREAGVVRNATRRLAVEGETREVKAEQVTLGCGPDGGVIGRRSPPGAPCEHFSVCSYGRCPCPGSKAAYLARACVDGRCAPDALACSIVPSAVGHDACPGR